MSQSVIKMPVINDFRPFIICTPENYEETKVFYSDLGFKKEWDNDDSACEYRTGFGDQNFLVTLHYNIEPPKFSMLHFQIDDAQGWYDYMCALELEKKHPSTKITRPVVTPWGMYITYVYDPAGVKLHFAEPYSEANKKVFEDYGMLTV